MRKLDKPEDDPRNVFLSCISRVRNRALKARLTACGQDIVDSAEEYEEKVQNALLHEIAQGLNGTLGVTDQELINVYKSRMAPKGSPGRSIYDKLLSAPAQGRCPLCSQRVVTTIDHHLPESLYPLLSVVPINLVPSCLDCNKTKTTNYPRTSEEQTIHPYFDDIEGDIWLKADIVQSSPPSLTFFVIAPNGWQPQLVNRIKHHFKILHLNKLYSSHAGEELMNIQFQLKNLHYNVGASGVKNHLTETAISRILNNQNSWQSAMYIALSESDWFCAGGFDF